MRATRDSAAVQRLMAQISDAAAGDVDLMPLLLQAARAHASEGEIVQALQKVWGDYREQPAF